MKIGELAKRSGFPTRTIRYYEATGLLPAPERAANGYRSYGEDSMEVLQFVRRAATAGLTLREICQVLSIRAEGRPPCTHVASLLRDHLDQIDLRIAKLRRTRQELQTLADYADSIDPTTCYEGSICTILAPRRVEERMDGKLP